MPEDREDPYRETRSRSVNMRERALRAVDDLLESTVNLRDMVKLLKEGNDRFTAELKEERRRHAEDMREERRRCEERMTKALERSDRREANQRDFIKWLIAAIVAVSFGKEGLQILVSLLSGSGG